MGPKHLHGFLLRIPKLSSPDRCLPRPHTPSLSAVCEVSNLEGEVMWAGLLPLAIKAVGPSDCVSPLRCVSLPLPLGPHFTAKVTGIGLRDPKASTLVRGIDEPLPPTSKSVLGCGFLFGTVLKPYPPLSSSPRELTWATVS